MGDPIIYRDRKFYLSRGQVFDPAEADAAIAGVDTPRDGVAMSMDGYQKGAAETVTYPGHDRDQLIYPAISLAEEAGELAEVVLELLMAKHPGPRASSVAVAEGALGVAAACGELLGLVKKAYRNDPPGELTRARKGDIELAIRRAERVLGAFATFVEYSDRVEFPPIPVGDDEQMQVVKEAGDALWYLARCCTEAHVSLGYVGEVNYRKLADRARRDVLRSSGDDR